MAFAAVATLAFAAITTVAFAAPELTVPPLTAPVIDEVGVIDAGTRGELERLLVDFNRKGKAQVQVLVLGSLAGLPIEEASIRIVDQWKLGTAKADNGVLFLVAPNEKKMRIEVGQGLEGDLPDIKAKRITSDVVKPFFKAGRYAEGIRAGVYSVVGTIDPDALGGADWRSEDAGARGLFFEDKEKGRSIGWWIELIFFMLFPLAFFLQSLFRPRSLSRRGRYYGGWGGGGFGGGGFGGGSGGGGWSGGGGGFSGGGASDSW